MKITPPPYEPSEEQPVSLYQQLREGFRKSFIVRFFVLFYGLALLMIMALYLAHGIAVNWQ